METQTRYDLNAAIESWRSELAVQANLTAEVRRELETHLRDAITGFQQRGLNDEESFWLACKRVGQPPQLGEEFVKAEPTKVWRAQAFWMLSFIFLLNTMGVFTRYFPHFGLSNATILYSQLNSIALIAVGLLIVGIMRRKISMLTGLIGGRGRVTFVALTLILISAFFHYHYEVINRAWQAKIGIPADPYPLWKFTALTSFYPVLLAVLMLWLMPTQNRKIPKCV
jgi:hypothetical protein